jgi:hypothetical protein
MITALNAGRVGDADRLDDGAVGKVRAVAGVRDVHRADERLTGCERFHDLDDQLR